MQRPLRIRASDKEALALVKKILESDLGETPSLQKLCRKAGLNADKLKRGFKYLYGLPPHAYQRKLRMEEAQRLLKTTEMTIQEIAWAVGYEQLSSFCKAFKKFSGVGALGWKEDMARDF